MLGAASLLLVAAYPFMKRITWWPQAWLGLTFNWGALLGFAAQTGHLDLPDALLYAGLFFWTLGYDTIYAHQDKEDDALIGVKSTARLLMNQSGTWILRFYAACFTLVLAAGFAEHAGWPFALVMLAAGAHLLWQVRRLDINDAAHCLMPVPRQSPHRRADRGKLCSCCLGRMNSDQFIRANTELLAPPLVPEIKLHLATEVVPLWRKTEEGTCRKWACRRLIGRSPGRVARPWRVTSWIIPISSPASACWISARAPAWWRWRRRRRAHPM